MIFDFDFFFVWYFFNSEINLEERQVYNQTKIEQNNLPPSSLLNNLITSHLFFCSLPLGLIA